MELLLLAVFRIRIRIRMDPHVFGILDPDPDPQFFCGFRIPDPWHQKRRNYKYHRKKNEYFSILNLCILRFMSATSGNSDSNVNVFIQLWRKKKNLFPYKIMYSKSGIRIRDLDPGSGSGIRIRIGIESWIRIRIRTKIICFKLYIFPIFRLPPEVEGEWFRQGWQ